MTAHSAQKRDKRLHLMYTAKEQKKLTKLAEKAGVSVGEYVRQLIEQAA